MKKLILVFIILLTPVQNAAASNLEMINSWYIALRTINRPAFELLLSDTATIELKQLDVIQDKSEFIESLDTWEEVAGDVFISTTMSGSDGTKTDVLVCYRFPSDAFTNRETFWIIKGQIIRQIQERLQDGC
ncbi:MAG: hypothetical protein ACR2O3_02935 [Rhizobiaceae bacterium]